MDWQRLHYPKTSQGIAGTSSRHSVGDLKTACKNGDLWELFRTGNRFPRKWAWGLFGCFRNTVVASRIPLRKGPRPGKQFLLSKQSITLRRPYAAGARKSWGGVVGRGFFAGRRGRFFSEIVPRLELQISLSSSGRSPSSFAGDRCCCGVQQVQRLACQK